jgi:hypothetical protein
MERCKGQTLKKAQCKRSATVGSYCSLHVPKVEPWTALSLPCPNESNRKSILTKLRTKLRQPAAKRSGGAGHIYIYYIKEEHDAYLMYWKIGMTERSVKVRLAEWARVHSKTKGTLLLAKTYRITHAHKWVERVIHLYLNYCRVYRYVRDDEDGSFYSVWAATHEPCPESVDNEDEEGVPVATHKQVEWFHALDLKEIDALITSIILTTVF